MVEQVFDFIFYVLKLSYRSFVFGQERSAGRHFPTIVFVSQDECAVYEVSVDGNQLVVVSGLEILPRKVVVLRLRSVGREHITQYVLFVREVGEIFVQPNGPIARGRNLAILEIQKFVGRNIVGQDVFAVRFQHRGEDDAMEDDVILADKVD